MRTNFFGESIATPEDTVDELMDAWPDFTPDRAEIFSEPDGTFLYGGEAIDSDADERRTFDGFNSLDEARTFAVEILGIPAHAIEEMVG